MKVANSDLALKTDSNFCCIFLNSAAFIRSCKSCFRITQKSIDTLCDGDLGGNNDHLMSALVRSFPVDLSIKLILY